MNEEFFLNGEKYLFNCKDISFEVCVALCACITEIRFTKQQNNEPTQIGPMGRQNLHVNPRINEH